MESLYLQYFKLTMELKIADSWINISQKEFDKPYFKSLASFVASAYENHKCFPKKRGHFCCV
jgi:uracil DNA glycosylase